MTTTFALPDWAEARLTPYLRRELSWTQKYRGYRVRAHIQTANRQTGYHPALHVSVRALHAPIDDTLAAELVRLMGREQYFPAVENQLGRPGAYGFVVDRERLAAAIAHSADRLIASIEATV